MILLKDKFLTRLKYFYGTDKEWLELIKYFKKNKKREIVICDPSPLAYPKGTKVIRSIRTAKRTLFLDKAIVFFKFQGQKMRNIVDNYLRSDSFYFYSLSKRSMLEYILLQKDKITVQSEKVVGRYWH